MITIAPPASGKSQAQVMPTLLRHSGPAVVLDPKGELWSKTSLWRQENVGPVFRFDPTDPAKSHSYNPLDFVRTDDEHVWEDSRLVADLVVVASGKSDPFWTNRARDVVGGAIAWACLNPDLEGPSFSQVLDVVGQDRWERFKAELGLSKVKAAKRMMASLKSIEPKVLSSILETAREHLSVWEGEKVERSIARSEWRPEALRRRPYPTIYLCTPREAIGQYLPLLRVIMAQHLKILLAAKPDPEVPPVLFCLDEFPLLGRCEPVLEGIAAGRDKAKFWLFAQGLDQLRKTYGNENQILELCQVMCVMNPSITGRTADMAARLFPREESFFTGRTDAPYTAHELAGPDFVGRVLIFAKGENPLVLDKAFVSGLPDYAARIGEAKLKRARQRRRSTT